MISGDTFENVEAGIMFGSKLVAIPSTSLALSYFN